MQRPDGRIIDTKLPLTWLLSTAGTIIITLAGITINFNKQTDSLNNKMDTLLNSNTEMKMQSEKRDGKLDTLREQVYSTQRTVDTLDLRVGTLERGNAKGK